MGTDLKDRSVYVRLPADAGTEYAGKIIRLMKACYGLKSSSSEFVKQLSRQILSFEEDQIGLKWRLVTEALPEDAQLLQNQELGKASNFLVKNGILSRKQIYDGSIMFKLTRLTTNQCSDLSDS